MEIKNAIEALAALAHPHRLAAFRLLMRQGPTGLPAGGIARALDVPPSTLSHHLACLERARLVRSRRVERRIFYACDIEGTRQLLAFLTEDCCRGQPALCGTAFTPTRRFPEDERMTPTPDGVFTVLFLCTGNSARSILAEAILNRLGRGRFRAFSAGSRPTGRVNPHALDLLERLNHPTAGLRSKAWDEFAGAGAPRLDFVVTVCDNAAGEVCPVWPGQPMTAHWGVEDPAAVAGDDATKMLAFRQAFRELENRIKIFVSLPFQSLDKIKLKHKLDEIGTIRLPDLP